MWDMIVSDEINNVTKGILIFNQNYWYFACFIDISLMIMHVQNVNVTYVRNIKANSNRNLHMVDSDEIISIIRIHLFLHNSCLYSRNGEWNKICQFKITNVLNSFVYIR